MKQGKVSIIGSGFAGLASACMLAREGLDVTVFEKNEQIGGRARVWEKDGFRFDMGPSWYWMPEIFENFFQQFGYSSASFYKLHRLDPSYRVYWGPHDFLDIPAGLSEVRALFETMEPGTGPKFDRFIDQARYKYHSGMGDFVFRPSHSALEYADLRLFASLFRLQMFSSVSSHIRHYFRNPRIIKLLEFPVLFLGGTAQTTPALYSMMNYADLALGTWYPEGGMSKITNAMQQIATELGVTFKANCEVTKIRIKEQRAAGVESSEGYFSSDLIIANADYAHTDQKLLDPPYRSYSSSYWEKRTFSPSCLLFFIGTNKKIKGISHHNLFFDEDFTLHSDEIYRHPQWPQRPLFYVCCPSKTDHTVAPATGENLFFLMPVAPGLPDNEAIRAHYFELLTSRFERITGETLTGSIILKRSYAINDFIDDYHSYKGNAYGLANTLLQTAFLKPRLQSKKVPNLFYTGQLTVPGPGVPPAIISGQVAAKEAMKYLFKQ